MSDFVIWSTEIKPQFTTVGGLANVPDPHELKRGVSRIRGFPEDASFKMDPKRPKAVQLPDNVHNLPGLVLVSKKLKELIEAAKPSKVEYLAVKIIDHKGRAAAAEYFIVNQVGLQDCIDPGKSKVTWNKIEPEMISSCGKLVIDESRIEGKLTLLRPKHLPTVVLVRRSLADQLLDSDASGLSFEEIEDFSG